MSDPDLEYHLALHPNWSRKDSMEYCYQGLLAVGFLWLLFGGTLIITGCDSSPLPTQSLLLGIGVIMTILGSGFLVYVAGKVKRLQAPRSAVMKAILCSVYLHHLTPNFREEGICPTKFLKLNQDVLYNLGVKSFGDRAKLRCRCLQAINNSEAQTVGELMNQIEEENRHDQSEGYTKLDGILHSMGLTDLITAFHLNMVSVYEVEYLEGDEFDSLGLTYNGYRDQLLQRCREATEGSNQNSLYVSSNRQENDTQLQTSSLIQPPTSFPANMITGSHCTTTADQLLQHTDIHPPEYPLLANYTVTMDTVDNSPPPAYLDLTPPPPSYDSLFKGDIEAPL